MSVMDWLDNVTGAVSGMVFFEEWKYINCVFSMFMVR